MRITAPPSGPLLGDWHRPLLALALLMAGAAVASAVGLLVDQRELVGAAAWAKPLKFALSIGVYSVTLAWLIGQLRRWRRVAWWAGTLTAIVLAIEMVIIIGAVLANTTSHFNVSTPFNIALWSVMAGSVVAAWVASMAVAMLLFRTDLGSPARSIAIRAGVALSLVGMALAFQMAKPTSEQLRNPSGVEGAHAVGTSDAGPGLFLLGWSTIGGDLRVPHFVGMHAVQVLPLVALLLAIAARKIPLLRDPATQTRLVATTAALYFGALVVLEVQATIGQSVITPSIPIAVAATALFGGATLATALILRAARKKAHSPTAP
ncbi:hypothetical protein E3O42_00040 [Cryobacterium adonitolivorans]|uniref:Uncharacterized protein n=1 Tax=Cryobacterium adonitolivorans TaxID=1259189 RepID=A0A4R8WGK0_9MICO|nr:hypothetical protein [Cryobacterium adonitolivorans]TFC07172.1 hypothetical protein E3O42_00040 [Cryobacterium adonitolivorans]